MPLSEDIPFAHRTLLLASGLLACGDVQEFYRIFRGPGVAHRAGQRAAAAGPVRPLVNRVENKVPQETILARNASGGAVTRTRALCPYPQTAVYKGSGSTDDAANFSGGGNPETTEQVCDSVLARYKHEAKSTLDSLEGGTSLSACTRRGVGPGKRGN